MAAKQMWDLIVIGGGAAGLWAGGTAAARGRSVLVIEKNKKPGVKILMSGGTRCNITHHCGIDGILQAFGHQGRFLKPALFHLSPQNVVDEINRLGVQTKVEDTGKVFPVSDRALDVRDALLRRLQNAGGNIRSGVEVADVAFAEAGKWRVAAGNEALLAKKVLLCAGGLSYPGCGTTGDGYAWAERVGHTMIQTRPALTPILSSEAWVHQLSGITLPDVSVQVLGANILKKDARTSSRGGFLWTHFGCSGPAAMNVSRFVDESSSDQSVHLQLDLVPDENEERIAKALDASSGGRRSVGNVLQQWLPKKLATSLVQMATARDTMPLAELPRKARLRLQHDLKRLRLPVSGNRGYEKAEVTRGGVVTKEVNPKTMESRLAPGLFFAGEILDIDGPIGGYNFQAAFSTGHTAALNV